MQQQFFQSILDCNTSSEGFHLFDSPNCLIGLFCTSRHDTFSTDLSISCNQQKKLFLIAYVLFSTYGGFQMRLNFGRINIH